MTVDYLLIKRYTVQKSSGTSNKRVVSDFLTYNPGAVCEKNDKHQNILLCYVIKPTAPLTGSYSVFQ